MNKRLISWNVNGIRSAAEKGLFEFLASASPDVLCLQETKAQPEILTKNFHEAIDGEGRPYNVHWSSAKRKGYSGVAAYSRIKPDAVETLGIDEFDDEGRFLSLRFGTVHVISAYFPNSQEAGARLQYKLGFCRAVKAWCDARVADGGHVVLSGDYNIAHKPIDLAHPKANEGNPGYLPEERAWMDEFTASGYVDTFRHFCKEPDQYSWWSYRMRAREKNVGWRLDYHCVDPSYMEHVKGAAILQTVMGSDHCPVELLAEL